MFTLTSFGSFAHTIAFTASLLGAEPEEDWLAWDGQGLDRKPVTVIQEKLAEGEFLIRSSRNYDRAAELFLEARILSTSVEEFPDQSDWMSRSITAEVKCLVASGRYQEAHDRAYSFLLPPGFSSPPYQFVTAPRHLVDLRAMMLNQHAYMNLLGTIPRPTTESTPHENDWTGLDEKQLDYVRQHFGEIPTESWTEYIRYDALGKDFSAWSHLSSRATSALAILSLTDAGDRIETLIDPLRALAELDDPGAARLILDHIDFGARNWTLRILDILNEHSFQSGDWIVRDAAWEHRNPAWLDICAAIVRDPSIAVRCDALSTIAQKDALTPGLVDSLVQAVNKGDAQDREQIIVRLSSNHRTDSTRPIFEAALAAEIPSIRRLAASSLSKFPDSHLLRKLAEDSDRAVRAAVVESMTPRYIMLQHGNHSPTRAYVTPILDDNDRKALSILVRDPSPDIRIAAIDAALSQANSLPIDLFMTAARSPDPRVRAHVAQLTHPHQEGVTAIFKQLADDDVVDVRDAIDQRLSESFNEKDSWSEEAGRVLSPALFKRATDADHPHDLSLMLDRLNRGGYTIFHTEAGLRTLLELALAPDSSLIPHFIKAVTRPEAKLAIAPTDAIELLRHPLVEAASLTRHISPKDRDTLRELVLGDDSLPITTRVSAIVAINDGYASSPATQAALEKIVVDPRWKQGPGVTSSLFRNVATPRLFHVAAADPSSDPRVLRSLAEIASYIELTAETGALVIDRLIEFPEPLELVSRLVSQLATSPPTEERLALLTRALDSGVYSLAAIDAMKRSRVPEHIPLLNRALKGEQMPVTGDDLSAIRTQAARALSAYNDPAVVSYLLEGLRLSTDDTGGLTQVIQELLATHLKYEETQQRLQKGAPQEVTRENSLAQLILLINHDQVEIRIEAIRALGTFADELALPYLIPLVADPANDVKAAARQAIDEIRAAKAELPKGDGSQD